MLRGVASIIGEVILVSFTFAVALAYLAYVNSSINTMSQNLPPQAVVEAQKNQVRVVEFESSNTSVFFTSGVLFNVKIVTYLGLLGFDRYGNPVPLSINYAEKFSGSDILFPNTTVPVQSVPVHDVYILYNERYVKLGDFNTYASRLDLVKVPFNSPFLAINATLPGMELEKIRISAFTLYNNKYYEYASVQVNLPGG